MVLLPAWDPSLLVPTQLIPASLALALTSALKTSLGVCTPPFVEGDAMSILTGSLVFGSLNTKLLPGASTTLSRWWSGPVTMTSGLLAAANAAPLVPASASSAALAATACRRRLFLIRRAPVAGAGAGVPEIDLAMTCSFPGGSIPLLLRCASMASIDAGSCHFLDIHLPGHRWQPCLARSDGCPRSSRASAARQVGPEVRHDRIRPGFE